MSTERQKPKLKPTEGVVDYASEYKKFIYPRNKMIESAKYFVKMRKSHLTEILNTWDDVVDDINLEQAELILNEFLSPKCTLLEFEYKNLTKAGREQPVPGKTGDSIDSLNEIWQKHILGRVLTGDKECAYSISIPANSKSMFDGTSSEDNKTEKLVADKEEKPSYSLIPEKLDIEVYQIYQRIRWFIKNIEVDKLSVSDEMKNEIKQGIERFNRSFATTWKVVNCLVYMEIVESLRSDASKMVSVVFGKCAKMMIEEKKGVLSQQSADLLKCAHLFILKYRGGSDEDTLFRCGFGFLSVKLQIAKATHENLQSVLSVAGSLAEEEMRITQVYDILQKVFNFETCKI